jgi:hypothetical protein
MHATKFTVFIVLFGLLLGLAGQARADSKHFQASQRHFEELATKAASLSADMDTPGEKNVCNYFTATAMTYAVRAHALAQLSDVADKVHLPEDKALLRQKLAETETYSMQYIESDLRFLEDLSAPSRNSRIRELGMRLVNELRVFQHNAESLANE